MRFLDSARKSVYASCHEVDMIAVAEKLAERARDGIDVQIVVESKWWDGRKNTAARRVLEKSKVKVSKDTKASGLMHNKFFVVDRKRVWTGSTNMTETCLLYNPNSAVWVENARVAQKFYVEFEEERASSAGAARASPTRPSPRCRRPSRRRSAPTSARRTSRCRRWSRSSRGPGSRWTSCASCSPARTCPRPSSRR